VGTDYDAPLAGRGTWSIGAQPAETHRDAVMHLQGGQARRAILCYRDARLLIHIQPHPHQGHMDYLVTVRVNGRYASGRHLPSAQEAVAYAEEVALQGIDAKPSRPRHN